MAITARTSPTKKAPPRQRADTWRTRRARWDLKLSPYAFISPFFILFAAFGLYPLIWTAWMSLHRVELSNPDQMTWLGLKNFTDLLSDSHFWNAFTNTFTIGVISTVPQLLIALGLAHILNYKLRGRTFFRIAVLTPYATSVAASAIVFAQLFGRDYGFINWLLSFVGVDNIDFTNSKWPAQIAISVIVIWRWTGYNALIYLAAMQAIPQDLYESAAMDGASRWQQFWNVTIPGLRPTIVFTVIVSTIGASQLFGEPMLFGGGGSPEQGGADNQYQTLAMYFFERGFTDQHLGRAAAVAWAMFLLIVVFVAINTLLARRARSAN
ncbi:carbohydrate ABC transporter permease [Streptomyces sp. AP-93]|uniref:carbohydrate ABC transporter permease n=1 Tax=Streptomyces sp. AP-93 TaxID=2929048 RepID=UPI001FAFA644|nr:sugar ABC transporter permease [Streptomyces sp. AP-93]MCJ0867791.1 sugar ABC transporter permease [Streptomyces sp. AP-93]